MSIYKAREFAKFARKASLGADDLIVAADAVASRRWDADLGGGVFKQRVAREGAGKSGGFRTLIVFKAGGQGSSSSASPRTIGRTSRRRN